MTIGIIDDPKIWDEFVNKSAQGLLFHKWNFLSIIEKHSKLKLYRLGIYHGENLISILPIFIRDQFFFRFIFSPPPQTGVPHLGFLMNSEYDTLKQNKKESFIEKVVTDINNFIENLHPNYVSFSTVPGFLDIRQFKWFNYSVTPSFNYFIDLDKNLDEIYNGFKWDIKRDIRKAEKEGLTVKFDSNISTIYSYQKRRYSEQGNRIPLFSEYYIIDLMNTYPDELMVSHMYDNNDNLLSSIIFSKYKHFTLWLGGTKPKGYSNALLFWRLIEYAKNINFNIFEIIGANTQNLNKFKSQFNPRLEVGFSIVKSDWFGNIAKWFYFNIIKKENTFY